MRLKGKTAIITGGAGSLGSAQTRLFVAQGAQVVFVDVVTDDGRALQAELSSAGGEASFVQADITTAEGWNTIREQTVASHGGVDVLVNNAGLTSMLTDDPFDTAVWQKMIDVKMSAPILGIHAVLPSMIERGGGSIVNVCSLAALIACDPGNFGYTASNAGLAGLTRAVASRYGRHQVRVNNIYPGAMPPMRSPGGASSLANSREALEAMTALGRIGEPRDIAYAALYLASDESSYVTGADLVVDGGVAIR
jgi:NAD(P)-dependent dehydrogenase (short-subunit alcohol dehydrogenase family)